MKSYKIAAIPGDGIDQEVVAAGVEVMYAIARRDRRPEMASIRARWNGVSAVAFYGRGAVHEGHDIVPMKVLSDRRGEGGGIDWLVWYSVHVHVGWPEYPHAVVASRIPSLVPPRALILGIYLVARSTV